MSKVENSGNQFGGEYLIQDQDHAVGNVSRPSKRTGSGQTEQAQSHSRQQGNEDQSTGGQQGGESRRKSR